MTEWKNDELDYASKAPLTPGNTALVESPEFSFRVPNGSNFQFTARQLKDKISLSGMLELDKYKGAKL